jgi:hypothetical protein
MERPTTLAPTPITEPTELSAAGTVLLWRERSDGKFEDSGTGFFHRNGQSRFIVTAKHVLLDLKTGLRPRSVRIRLKTSPEDLHKAKDVTLSLWEGDSPRFRWADDPVDLAAIPVPEETTRDAYIRDVVPEYAPPDDLVVPLGAEVLIVGFPKGLYDEANNLPLARQGCVASVYRAHFNDRPVFKIDAHLHSEMSGAPVFLRPTCTLVGRKSRFELRNGLVSFFLGVHFSGLDNLELHEAYYPELVSSLTRPVR